jgi:hypothetical protein
LLAVYCTEFKRTDPLPFVDAGEDVAPSDSDGGSEPIADAGPTDAVSDAKAPVDAAKGRVVSVLASGQTGIRGLALVGDELFFGLGDAAAAVRAIKVNGTGLRPLAGVPDGGTVNVADVALFGDRVAWTNTSDGLFHVARMGTPGTARVSGGVMAPLASHDDELFFFANFNQDHSLRSYKLSDTNSVERIKFVISPIGVVADATTIYWTERGPLAVAGGGVKSLPRSAPPGTKATVLFSGGADWEGGRLALGTNDVFFAEPGKGRVGRVPKAGGTATVAMSSLKYPYTVLIDGDDVFVLDIGEQTNDGALYRGSVASAGPAELLASGLGQPTRMVLDKNSVYVACTGSGDLLAVSRLP